MFLVAAIMQGILLVMCLCWKVRQRKLRIDDFGHPLRNSPLPELPIDDEESIEESDEDSMEEDIVSITAEEAEQTPLVANRRRRRTKKWKWRSWIRWLGTK
jgi:hypothetical protein